MSPAKAKVILLEDNQLLRECAILDLQEAGHTVLFAEEDRDTAINKLENLSEAPDVAILDGMCPTKPGRYMSEYAGGDVASKVKELFPETTIVMFSSREKTFSEYRFPPKGIYKDDQVIEGQLGQFVTNLPASAKK